MITKLTPRHLKSTEQQLPPNSEKTSDRSLKHLFFFQKSIMLPKIPYSGSKTGKMMSHHWGSNVQDRLVALSRTSGDSFFDEFHIYRIWRLKKKAIRDLRMDNKKHKFRWDNADRQSVNPQHYTYQPKTDSSASKCPGHIQYFPAHRCFQITLFTKTTALKKDSNKSYRQPGN